MIGNRLGWRHNAGHAGFFNRTCPRPLGLLALSLMVLALSACVRPLGDTEPELALEDIASGFGKSRLKQAVPAPSRQTIEYRMQDRSYRADLYLSPLPPRAAIVLVPGVVPEGKDDLRLVALAMSLARLRYAVLVPDIEGLRRFQVRGRDVQAVADAFRYLSSWPELAPQGRAGIAGFSYGAGPVLLAALEPDIRARVRFVLAMGGYHDLNRLVTFFTTSHYLDDESGQWRFIPADPYAVWVFALSNAELLEREADRTWLRDYVMSLAEEGKARAPDELPELAPDAKALVELLLNKEPGRVPELIENLSPAMRAELDAINPAVHDLSAMQAQVILVHGRSDNIIHYTESLALARALPPDLTRLFLIEGVAHVDVRLEREDVPKLVEAMTLLLDQRAPP